MKNNKSNLNNDYFIKKWCGVYSRDLQFFSSMEVSIKYRVLNGKHPTNVDALTMCKC